MSTLLHVVIGLIIFFVAGHYRTYSSHFEPALWFQWGGILVVLVGIGEFGKKISREG